MSSDKEIIQEIVSMDKRIALISSALPYLNGDNKIKFERVLKALKMSRNALNETLRVVYGLEVAILNSGGHYGE